MEDASKEFKIFMSPKRDYRESIKEISTSKQRMVPVISKLSPCSLFQTFAMNQKKTYKAVSGVSFQNSSHDSQDHKPKSDRSRRQSMAPPSSPRRSHQTELISGGARRSRSLTSMESEYSSCVDTNRREIIYPCTPIILSSGSSNQSQYLNGRKKRRSSSQIRTNTSSSSDTKRNETLQKVDTHPVRPRRTRSASRSRKSNAILSSLSNENLLPTSSKVSPEETVRSERKYRKHSKNDRKISSLSSLSNKSERTILHSENTSTSNQDIDFNVNDTDWQKYDILVSKQLNNILKGKEEPEGGYFSLEREEGAEDLDKTSSEGEYFQRENSNESIYVPQNFAKKDLPTTQNKIIPSPQNTIIQSQNTVTPSRNTFIPSQNTVTPSRNTFIPSQNTVIPSQDNITIEEIYREVLFDSPPQEVGYADDEGLYEEIYFERKLPSSVREVQEPPKPKNLIVNLPINILISPESQDAPPSTPLRNKRPSRSSLSTIVHIGGKETGDIVTSHNSSSKDTTGSERSSIDFTKPKDNSNCMKQNLWCMNDSSNQITNNSSNSSRYYQSPFTQNKSTSVDRCHSSSNLLDRHSDLESYQLLPDLRLNDHHLSIRENSDDELDIQKNVKEKTAFFQRLLANTRTPINSQLTQKTTKTTCSVDRKVGIKNSTSSDEVSTRENELLNQKRKTKSEPYLLTNSDNNFTDVEYRSDAVCISCPLKTNKSPVASPPSFQGFLQNSLFNPDTESLIDDLEELVIDDDQIVTCIMDSSSSESEDESADSSSSNLWLEAKNEFEFVDFKTQQNKVNKERKSKKSIPKVQYKPLSLYSGLLSSHSPVVKNSHIVSDFHEVPERPSRRRKRTDFPELLHRTNC